MNRESILALAVALLLGALARDVLSGRAQAEAPSVDRALVERLVRAEEEQTRAIEGVARQIERCRN